MIYNENLLTVTDTSEDSAGETNLSKNQEVGFLSSAIIPADTVGSG